MIYEKFQSCMRAAVIHSPLAVAVPASGPNRTIEGVKTIVVNRQLVINTLDVDNLSVGQLLDGNGAPFSLNATLSAVVRLVVNCIFPAEISSA